MTNCKACGKEIASGVKKCVHCGKDQRNFLMQHKVITGVLVVILLAIIGSAMNGNKDTTGAVANNGATGSTTNGTTASITNGTTGSTTTASEKPVVKDIYAVNEDVKLNDAVITVTKVAKSQGGDYDKPKDGMEFVIVTVVIKNGGKDQISYNPFDFKMQNSKGQITSEAFTTVNTSTQLSSGDLAANGEITGTIAFEQPKNDAALVLKYKGNIFSNEEIKFRLN